MNHQQPTHYLAAFELPIEEFEDQTPCNVDSRTDLPTLSVENRRTSWRWKETLGRGSCGCVWLQERGADLRAVKMIPLSQLRENGIDHLNEISAMARLSRFKHNDRAVFGEFYGYSMNNKSLFLAMEYFPLRDLKRHIEARIVNEEEAKKIVHDVLVGLKIMHAEGIVHRDLKPENIFVAGKPPDSCWSVKIADFGISKRIPPEGEWNLTLWRGTWYYLAPEVQELVAPCQEYPGAMDMWSLGIIVYFLATKQYPLADCRNDRKMLEKWSGEGRAFIEGLLKRLPRDRLSAEEALRHPWITSMATSLQEVDRDLVPGDEHTVSEYNKTSGIGATTSSDTAISNIAISDIASSDTTISGIVISDIASSDTTISGIVISDTIVSDTDIVVSDINISDTAISDIAILDTADIIISDTAISNTAISDTAIADTADIVISDITISDTAISDTAIYKVNATMASHPQGAFTPSFNDTIASYRGQTYRVASPGPLPPLRMITAPTSFANGTPPAGGWQNRFYDFTSPNSPREESESRTPLQQLVWDAVDLISPRTEQTEDAAPSWGDRFPQEEAPDSTSSSRERSLTSPLNLPSPAPPPNTSLILHDTRLTRLSRSMSDSLIQPSYALSRTDREWRRASAVEFVKDPRFRDSVHALYHAIQSGRDEVVELLLDAGVDIETIFRNLLELQKGTALHLAVSCGHTNVAGLLLRRGARLTAKAKAKLPFEMKSLEPLHLAAFYGFEEIARMLLANGARIEANATGNFRERKKRTPLHLAVLGEESDEVPRMVRLLLQHGADPNVKDTLGMKPGDYAVMVGRKDLTGDLPASPFGSIKAKVAKVRNKFEPLALAAPLLFGAGVAMVLK